MWRRSVGTASACAVSADGVGYLVWARLLQVHARASKPLGRNAKVTSLDPAPYCLSTTVRAASRYRAMLASTVSGSGEAKSFEATVNVTNPPSGRGTT